MVVGRPAYMRERNALMSIGRKKDREGRHESNGTDQLLHFHFQAIEQLLLPAIEYSARQSVYKRAKEQ
jgi:hypothetical protein